MNPLHRNHEALLAAAQAREEMVRLELRTVNGLWFIPSVSGYLALRYVPANLAGLCNATFFDKQGRETRTNVSVRLPGDSNGKAQSSTKEQPLLEAGRNAAAVSDPTEPAPAEEDGAEDEDGDEDVNEDEAEGEGGEEMDEDGGGSDDELGQGTGTVEVLDREERLLSDLTTARRTQIRTAVSAHEEATGMQIEAEKLRIIRGHSYTREIGENHQLMTMMRRDIAAMLATMREVGRSQVVSAEAAGNSVLRMADKVAKRLRDPAFAPPPPPPPPPPDYAGIAIALLNTVGRIGSAWAPGRKRSTSKKKALLRLLTEAQGPIAGGDPDGLKELLETFAKAEAKAGGKADAKSTSSPATEGTSSKPQLSQSSTLAELIDSGQLRELLENGKLKQLIDSGQLAAILNALSGDK